MTEKTAIMIIEERNEISERNMINYNPVNQKQAYFTFSSKDVGNEPPKALYSSNTLINIQKALVIKMGKFDLFTLHNWEKDRRPTSWICGSGKNLKKEIEIILKKLEDKGITLTSVSKKLSEKCCLREKTIKNIFGREWIPLFALEFLCKEASSNIEEFKQLKNKIQESLEKLKVNSSMAPPINAVKTLDITICKIAGAHAADGCVCHNEKFFVLRDQFITNVKIFSKWLKDEFGIEPVIKKVKNKNAWGIAFNNKAFTRFLMKILGFKNGRKADTVAEPELIGSSELKFEKAFALGVMTFEASVNSDKTIGLAVISEELRNDIFKILKKSGLNVRKSLQSNLKDRKDKWLILTRKLNNDELSKVSVFFEKGSSAWVKVNEFLGGFSISPNSIEEVEFSLGKRFPFLVKTLKLVEGSKVTNTQILSNELNLGKTSIRRHIDLLKAMNIVKVTRVMNKFDVSFLPPGTKVGLEEKFRNLLFQNIKEKMGSFANLCRLLNKKDFTITRWKNGERRIDVGSLTKLVDIAELSLSKVEENVNSLNKDRIFFNPEINTWKIPQVII